jgi:hypothetical protein
VAKHGTAREQAGKRNQCVAAFQEPGDGVHRKHRGGVKEKELEFEGRGGGRVNRAWIRGRYSKDRDILGAD